MMRNSSRHINDVYSFRLATMVQSFTCSSKLTLHLHNWFATGIVVSKV